MSDAYASAVAQVSRVPGVQGAMIAEMETGLPVVSELTEDVAETALAALATSLFRRGNQAATGGDLGSLRSVQLETEDGHVLAVAAGELLLVVLAAAGSQLGLIRLEARRAAESLA
jgi:predicted regulator of Ras-like GTPase activity (Roadblock/LC7/MglB family)